MGCCQSKESKDKLSLTANVEEESEKEKTDLLMPPHDVDQDQAAASDDASAVIPDSMYNWRVSAMRDWIRNLTEVEKRAFTMQTLIDEAENLDQYHYYGVEANDKIITTLKVTEDMHLLDIGSGIGGVSRYLSWKTGCRVLGIDIQADLVEEATRVTALLSEIEEGRVKFEAADATKPEFELEENTFDAFYSILVFLHIPKGPRQRIFEKAHRWLKADGTFVIEDYVLRDAAHPLTSEEETLLNDKVGAVYMPSTEQYRLELENAGFVDVEFEDLTESWTTFTEQRRDIFLKQRDEHAKIHGEEHAALMEDFFRIVPDLFNGGRLGGCRITGRKGPSKAEEE